MDSPGPKESNEVGDSLRKLVDIAKGEEARREKRELIAWWVLSVALVVPFVLTTITLSATITDALDRYSPYLIASAVSAVFPVVFKLIFDAYPFGLTRNFLDYARQKGGRGELLADQQIIVYSDEPNYHELSRTDAIQLFSLYCYNSRRLSKSIYNRAGVYLLVGVFVAFAGLYFFYAATGGGPVMAEGGVSELIQLAPKFGILFFIEFVAFFFLKQYRAAMDEFRYYEAIKRKREETLALIRLIKDRTFPATSEGTSFDPMELIKNNSFFSRAGVLGKDETSEIIESRKLEKNELDVLEKVIDVISRSKK